MSDTKKLFASAAVCENACCPSLAACEEWAIWKAKMVHSLRDGDMAIQIFASGVGIMMPDADQPVDLWSADPWGLISRARPQAAVRATVVCWSLQLSCIRYHYIPDHLCPTLFLASP